MISNAKIGQSLISNGEHTRVECRAYNILQWNIGYTTYYSGMQSIQHTIVEFRAYNLQQWKGRAFQDESKSCLLSISNGGCDSCCCVVVMLFELRLQPPFWNVSQSFLRVLLTNFPTLYPSISSHFIEDFLLQRKLMILDDFRRFCCFNGLVSTICIDNGFLQ